MATTLGFKDIEKLWTTQGGAPQYAPLMAGIALAESGGNPQAVNNTAFPQLPDYHQVGSGASPEYSVGLWQINLATGYQTWSQDRLQRYGNPNALMDPTRNAQAARNLLGNGTGLSNWQGDAAYAAYQSGGLGAVVSQYGGQTGGQQVGGSKSGGFWGGFIHGFENAAIGPGASLIPGSNPIKQAQNFASGVTDTAHFLGKLTQVNFWYRTGEVLLGGVLTLMGLYLLAKQVGLAPPLPAVPIPAGGSDRELATAFQEGVRQGQRAQARTAGRRSVGAVVTGEESADSRRRGRIRAAADADTTPVPF